jgi:hypothetical protein
MERLITRWFLLQNITVERSPRPTFGRDDRMVKAIIFNNNILK